MNNSIFNFAFVVQSYKEGMKYNSNSEEIWNELTKFAFKLFSMTLAELFKLRKKYIGITTYNYMDETSAKLRSFHEYMTYKEF
jgi:hypothetical protein